MQARPARIEDAEAVLEVCIARDVFDTGAPDYTLEDVRSDIETEGIDSWVAEDEDAIRGWAVLDERASLVAVDPAYEGRGAGSAILPVLEARMRERGIVVARQQVARANASGKRFLALHGYEPAHYFVKLRAERDELPDDEWPAQSRAYVPGADDEAAFAVVDEAFSEIPGNVPTSYALFRADLLEKSTFLAEHSRVIADDAGMLAVVLCELREGAGYVADLAVLPRGRGQGLGRALLRGALGSFARAGLDGGELWVNGANAPALGLYTSSGLREVSGAERWERALS